MKRNNGVPSKKFIKNETNKNKAKAETVEQISAGGTVFRRSGSAFEIAIISVNPSKRWQLPKGIIDAGESEEAAAVREVREETGLNAELLEKIETVEYWYFGNYRGERVRFHKLVHFYLMRSLGGSVADHDREVLEARWVSIDDAIEMLEFKSEKETVEKAKILLEKL